MSTAMIAITTKSSISVKPRRKRFCMGISCDSGVAGKMGITCFSMKPPRAGLEGNNFLRPGKHEAATRQPRVNASSYDDGTPTTPRVKSSRRPFSGRIGPDRVFQSQTQITVVDSTHTVEHRAWNLSVHEILGFSLIILGQARALVDTRSAGGILSRT